MNPENNVIILQGQPKDRCSDIAKLENKHNGKLQVTFNDGMTYLYNQSSVAWYTTPKDIAFYCCHFADLRKNRS